MSNKRKSKNNTYATNRKAWYNYEVLDKYEAGIVLKGSEVKSIKSGNVSLKDSFVSIDKGEAWLWNCHIAQWSHSSSDSYDPTRKRKLLLHRGEIDKLAVKVRQKGLTLVPLSMYEVRGRIKVSVGLCKGKKKYDKKRKEKERRLKREMHREKRKYMV
jgi:SsrA-binding protein